MENLTHQSKFLSLLLRHNPSALSLTMDENGWVDVQELVDKSKGNRTEFTKEILYEIVKTDNKSRYAYSKNGLKIRANQGHSIDVDVELKKTVPPSYLYHGTSISSLDSIKKTGLKKMNRQHVHLSIDEVVATNVGQRHGKPLVLTIEAKKMYNEKFDFFLSVNKVWLVDSVPVEYIIFPR